MYLPKLDTAGKPIGTLLIREPWDFIWLDLRQSRVLAGGLTEQTEHCAPLEQMIHVLNAQSHQIEVCLDSIENLLYQEGPGWWQALNDQRKIEFMVRLRLQCMREWKIKDRYTDRSSLQYIIGIAQQFMNELFVQDDFCASMLTDQQIPWYDIFEEDNEEYDETASGTEPAKLEADEGEASPSEDPPA